MDRRENRPDPCARRPGHPPAPLPENFRQEFVVCPQMAIDLLDLQCNFVDDVNGDGNPDVVTASADGGEVMVLPGHGDGTFSAARILSVAAARPFVTVADRNGDGRPDLVITDLHDRTTKVLLNTQGTHAVPLGDDEVVDNVDFGNQYVADPIFADGFETGDFSGWSVSVGDGR